VVIEPQERSDLLDQHGFLLTFEETFVGEQVSARTMSRTRRTRIFDTIPKKQTGSRRYGGASYSIKRLKSSDFSPTCSALPRLERQLDELARRQEEPLHSYACLTVPFDRPVSMPAPAYASHPDDRRGAVPPGSRRSAPIRIVAGDAGGGARDWAESLQSRGGGHAPLAYLPIFLSSCTSLR